MHFNLLVIGAGPAGWSAALQGAKLGMTVAVVEKGLMLGGACVRTGTLPSKTLRHTVLELVNSRRAARLGVHSTQVRPLKIQDLQGPRDALIENHQYTIRSFLERNHVEVLAGSASLVEPNRVRIATRDSEEIVGADHVVIATGSRPRRPDSIPIDDHVICDSDSLLGLDEIPRSLAVVGSGVIGCEYATIFATLGTKVSIIDRRERLLRFLDEAVLETLTYSMRTSGIRMMMQENVSGVEIEELANRRQGVVRLESGRKVRADRILVAAGRVSNTEALDLERVGIPTDDTGLIKVDDHYMTQVPKVYAVGDVIGFPALASTSMHQGRMAVLHMAGQPSPPARCREQGLPYEIGVARTAETPRGQIVRDQGLLKLIFRRDTKEILGVHMIGVAASELIHVGMMLVHMKGTIDHILTAVFNYPTLSECYRIAALDGLNRL
jgi:NAD(P) transhydrogenase